MCILQIYINAAHRFKAEWNRGDSSMTSLWWITHKGMIIGTSLGILLGFIYLFFGFLQMLVFLLIVAICAFIGKQFDNSEFVASSQRFWELVKNRRKR